MGIVERETPMRLCFARLRDGFQGRALRTAPHRSRDGLGNRTVRSIAKALSWRATGSIDTFVITLIITGSGVWASSIAATEIVTKIAFYYLHERAWSFVRWGRR